MATEKEFGQDPILEAICEFHFIPSQPWDSVIPGLIWNELKETFPRRRQCKIISQTFNNTPNGPEQLLTGVDRMQFLDGSGTSLVQTNPDFLSVNALKPYPTWSAFKPMIKQGLDAYCKAAEPKFLNRVGLRYINRIEIPGSKIQVQDYFRIAPRLEPPLPQDLSSYIVGVTSLVPEVEGQIKIQLSSLPEVAGSMAFVLDIDHTLVEPDGMTADRALSWIERSHIHILSVFRSAITDNTKSLFGVPK